MKYVQDQGNRVPNSKSSGVKLWGGILAMAFYVVVSVAQNELMQYIERGSSNSTNGTCPSQNVTVSSSEHDPTTPLRQFAMGIGVDSPTSSSVHQAKEYTISLFLRNEALSTNLNLHRTNQRITKEIKMEREARTEQNCTNASSIGTAKYDKPFFIVMFNHSFMVLMLPIMFVYLGMVRKESDIDQAYSPRRSASRTTPQAGRRSDRAPLLLSVNSPEDSPSASAYSPSLDGRSSSANSPTSLGSLGIESHGSGPSCHTCGCFSRITSFLSLHGVRWRFLWWTGLWAGFLFLIPMWCWYIGLPMKNMLPSEAVAVANSSFAWVYVISLCALKERVDPFKVIAVLVCMGGTVMLAIAGTEGGHTEFSMGIIVETLCALGQAIYFVAFRRFATRMGKLPPEITAVLAGFQGLMHLLCFWPIFVILDYTKLETFEWPTAVQARNLAIGASLASSGNVALMIGLTLLPNPLIASIATLLTTPVNYLADLKLHPTEAKSIGPLSYGGALLITVAFVTVIARDYALEARQVKSVPTMV
eukprot:m.370438 g.370438  ORF g.370438 m.370438 type:complete len:532 (+) comp20859_c0_seq1:210-1805(+)